MPEIIGSMFPQLLCACGSLFFAVVAVVFLVLLTRSSRLRQQLRATLANLPLQSIAALQPGQGLVRLKGVISQVPEPVPPLPDTAVLRVAMTRTKTEGDDRQQMDRIQTRPFLLDDGSGTVWVDPEGLDRSLLGEGVIPEGVDRTAALQAVGLPPTLSGSVQVWVLRAGQEVTVVGTVQQKGDQMMIAKARGKPLVVFPGDLPDVLAHIGRQTTTAWLPIGILSLIILCLLAIFGVLSIRVLLALLRAG